ncbi:uncharacterized protein LOC113360273 [Papaver somniferum]|uniref:uncharacterized protein LOC113360273 n=1 Tax=Papaver somniferum TaxID=3469 RepID=UPI000E7024C4|nr:uncharacterized protein LOC113360273 [Papaver somniferum]
MIMWQIWKFRCLTVFEGENSHTNSIIISIRNFCTKHNILGRENDNTRRHQAKITKKKWEKPPQNWLKLNFDATFDKHSKTCGIGLILRYCAGQFLEAMVKVINARDAEQEEGLALLEAVEWIKSRSLSKVIIEGDCKTVIEAVTSNFGNEAADGLAKYAKKYQCNQVWNENPLRCIHSIIELDKSV